MCQKHWIFLGFSGQFQLVLVLFQFRSSSFVSFFSLLVQSTIHYFFLLPHQSFILISSILFTPLYLREISFFSLHSNHFHSSTYSLYIIFYSTLQSHFMTKSHRSGINRRLFDVSDCQSFLHHSIGLAPIPFLFFYFLLVDHPCLLSSIHPFSLQSLPFRLFHSFSVQRQKRVEEEKEWE